MYSNEDILVNNARIKKTLIMLGILSSVFIVGIAVTLFYRLEWLTDLVSCVWGGLVIFLWSMYLTPLLHYRRYLRDVTTGLNRQMVAEFVNFNTALSTHDGVDVHEFEMSEGPKEKGEDMRMFYWDDSKPAPQIQPGETLRVTSHGNFILDWERI